jgi:hypothetical protein
MKNEEVLNLIEELNSKYPKVEKSEIKTFIDVLLRGDMDLRELTKDY